jgi:hypothetical protein
MQNPHGFSYLEVLIIRVATRDFFKSDRLLAYPNLPFRRPVTDEPILVIALKKINGNTNGYHFQMVENGNSTYLTKGITQWKKQIFQTSVKLLPWMDKGVHLTALRQV